MAKEQRPHDHYHQTGQALRAPSARTLQSPEWFPTRQRLLSQLINVQEVPVRTPLVKRLQDKFWQGDQYMDPVIQLGKAIGMSNIRKMLTQALDHDIESVPNAPKELASLFGHLDRQPEWFNEDDYERGRIALANASPIGRLVGLAMAFLVTAQAGSVANAVGSTAQYTRASAVIRRHVETALFFHRVSLSGGYTRSSETSHEIVEVRFMHAQVRAAAKKRWGPAVLAIHGNPISDADVTLGITAFGVQKLIGDCVFGRRFSSRDLDAMVRY